MSNFTYITDDRLVFSEPCKLLSLTISMEASGTGTVRVYDAHSALASQKVAEVYQYKDGSSQFRWEGLEMSRALFVEIYNAVDHATVEWEPCEPWTA